MLRTVEIPGDKIVIQTDVGPGRVVSAIVKIDDDSLNGVVQANSPSQLSLEEWERNFDEIIKLAPLNECPCDISRESAYLSDEELGR